MKRDLTVKGTRDFFPESYASLNHICGTWRSTALSYGFEEFEGPVLETLELYKIKSGEEILSQLYHFTDKGGRELSEPGQRLVNGEVHCRFRICRS